MYITSTQYTNSNKNQLLKYWKVEVYSKLSINLQLHAFLFVYKHTKHHTFPVKPLFTCKHDRKKKVNAFRLWINH